MSEIKGFDLSRLTQDENFGFHSFAIVEFEKCKDSKITEFVNNYKVKYNVFDGSMKVSGGENVLSYDVTRLDKVRDDAYRGLKRQNNVAMNDFDPVIAEIARQIDIILRRNGDPCSLPYLAENSAVINLIQDLATTRKKKNAPANCPIQPTRRWTVFRWKTSRTVSRWPASKDG